MTLKFWDNRLMEKESEGWEWYMIRHKISEIPKWNPIYSGSCIKGDINDAIEYALKNKTITESSDVIITDNETGKLVADNKTLLDRLLSMLLKKN